MQHVSHIKEIVSMQQAYARSSGVYEKVALKDLMDDVLDISRPGLERHGIAIEIDSEELPPITTDQHKVLQILLNLVRNAMDAVKESGNPDRQIKIRMFRIRDDRIAIRVADNGIGIPTEDLVRIFSWVYYQKGRSRIWATFWRLGSTAIGRFCNSTERRHKRGRHLYA